MITLAQAKTLTRGDYLYQEVATRHKRRKTKTIKWRVTSTKLWKRDEGRVRVGLRHGIHAFDTLTERDLPMENLYIYDPSAD